jgi:GT2 family glycosyltransferase
MNEPIDVSVVVISYNTRDWMETCIGAIAAASGPLRVEIIIVDNASKDGSADFIASRFPHIHLMRNSRNVGFGRAVNQGAAVARGEFVLLLNPDGHLKPGAIEALVAFARSNPQHIICGGRVLTPTGELDLKSCWAAPSLWSLFCSATLLSTMMPRSRLFDPECMGSFRRDHVRTVDIVSGCLFLMRVTDWRSMGGFDERYFVYGEDADLSLRARAQTGRTCAITPAAEMVHAVSASSSSRADKMELLLNGRIALARTHLPGWKGTVGAGLIVAGVWIRASLERLGVNRGTSWREVWQRRERWRRGYAPVTVPPSAHVAA